MSKNFRFENFYLFIFRFNIPQETEEKKNFNFRQLEEALKNFDSNNDIYTYDHYKENHVKDSRMSSEQAHSVLQGGFPGYGMWVSSELRPEKYCYCRILKICSFSTRISANTASAVLANIKSPPQTILLNIVL